MNWPALLIAVAAYLGVGLGFTAWFIHQLPPADRDFDRRDRLVLASYVVLWPIPAFALLVDLLDWPGFTR